MMFSMFIASRNKVAITQKGVVVVSKNVVFIKKMGETWFYINIDY